MGSTIKNMLKYFTQLVKALRLYICDYSSKGRRYLNFEIGLKRDEIKSFTKIILRD